MSTNTTPRETRPSNETNPLLPNVDIVETPTAYRLTVDLPGVAPEAIQIALDKDVLTLEATANQPQRAGFRLVQGEFESASYRRSFRLGFQVDSQQIEATCKNGRLDLVLPKAAQEQPLRIQVKATAH